MTTSLIDYVSSLLHEPGPLLGGSLERRVAALVCDVVGAARLASDQPELVALASTFRADGPSSSAVRGLPSTDRETAAFLNATAATWNELDEGHRGSGHPGVHVVCAAVALAEDIGAPGTAVLDAIVRGYQLQVALAQTFRLKPEVHAHGSLGAPAAALACAVLLDLDAERSAEAVGIAANLAQAGLFSACTEGATVRHTYAGAGAQTGLRAAALAAAGFVAPSDSIAVAYGAVRGDSFTGWRPHDGTWAISSGYLKSWAACASTHAAIDVAVQLMGRGTLVEQMETIVVRVPRAGADLGAVAFEPPLAARFSVPVLVASALAGHDLRDPAVMTSVPGDVASIVDRIRVVEEAELTAEFPTHSGARIDVTLADGTELSEHRLDPVTPATDEGYVAAVIAKAERLSTVTPRQADDLIAALLSCDPVPPLFEPGAVHGADHPSGAA